MSKTKPDTSVPAIITKPVPKLRLGDEQEIIARFKGLYHDAQNGLRRVAAFGLYAWSIKLVNLKHGQFGPWVEGNFAAEGISYRSVRSHMLLTKSALEQCGVKSIKNFIQNQIGNRLPISHCGEILFLEEGKLPDSLKPVREKLFSVIDGKTAKQLFAEFKQSEDDESDFPKAKRGRLKGQGGASKEQRAAAAAREEKARIEAIELEADDFCKWIDDNCDEKGFGLIADKSFNKLCDRAEFLWTFCRKLRDARKKGGAQ
jgi:hypothetical protein